MKRFFRIIISIAASVVLLLLSGYGNVLNDIEPSLAVTTFFGMATLFSILVILLWELHIGQKKRIDSLSKEIERLQEYIEKIDSGSA